VSRPSAWLAYAPDASESSFVTLFREQAETAAREWGWSVEPLFAGLTDAEREAVVRAWHGLLKLVAFEKQLADVHLADARTINKLLGRIRGAE
jgi:hypothetical protein